MEALKQKAGAMSIEHPAHHRLQLLAADKTAAATAGVTDAPLQLQLREALPSWRWLTVWPRLIWQR